MMNAVLRMVSVWVCLAATALSFQVHAEEPLKTIVIADSDIVVEDLVLPAITGLTIETNGGTLGAAPEPQPQCAGFRLQVQDVRSYLNRAQSVREWDHRHLLDWSPCFASGTVDFADGVSGVWQIQSLRSGLLNLDDGRNLYLYCLTCEEPPFTEE